MRAACCHLSLLTLFGTMVLPFLLGFMQDEDPEFAKGHRYGALVYQGLGLAIFAAGALVSRLPGALFDPFMAGAILTFYWSVYLSALFVFFGGAIYLAVQAWSGHTFDMGGLNQWVYDEPPTN